MSIRVAASACAVVLALSAGVACGSDDEAGEAPSPPADAVIDPGDGGDYRVQLDPAEFSATIDHPFLPLAVGAVWEYVSEPGTSDEETVRVEVLDETRTVMGVETRVVRDVVRDADGEVVEDTADWFAQRADGSVWYFGEETVEYVDGEEDTAGSWEAGVDGALPGVVMPAEPAVTGVGYRQEYLAGEAEDLGEVIALDGAVEVPAGTFDDVVVTRDWTPLEPDVVEEKTYARGVGLVRELVTAGEDEGDEVVLVRFSGPPAVSSGG